MKIVLNQGHTAGENAGAYNGYYEGTQMFYFGEILKSQLEMHGIQVKTTRNRLNDNLSLKERGQMGNGADLFLDLHSDYTSSSKNQVLVFDDTHPKYANNALADALLRSLTSYWNCSGRVVYRTYDDAWHDKPQSYAENFFGTMRNSKAKNNMLLELFNHRNADACKAFMKYETKLEIAKRLTDAITTHYKITKKASSSSSFYRVVTGSYKDYANAEKRVAELKQKGFESFIIKSE